MGINNVYCPARLVARQEIEIAVQYHRLCSVVKDDRKPLKRLKTDPYRPPSTKRELMENLWIACSDGYSTDTGNNQSKARRKPGFAFDALYFDGRRNRTNA